MMNSTVQNWRKKYTTAFSQSCIVDHFKLIFYYHAPAQSEREACSVYPIAYNRKLIVPRSTVARNQKETKHSFFKSPISSIRKVYEISTKSSRLCYLFISENIEPFAEKLASWSQRKFYNSLLHHRQTSKATLTFNCRCLYRAFNFEFVIIYLQIPKHHDTNLYNLNFNKF